MSEGGAEATGGSQGSTLSVVLSHVAQQGAHGDVHHGVASLRDDLQTEDSNQHGSGAHQLAGNQEEAQGAEEHNGDGCQDPGAELVLAGLSLSIAHVHDGAHQGVIDSVPNVPDQQHGCQQSSVDLQVNLQITGHEVPDRYHGQTAAAVTAAVADDMQECQLFGFLFCH